MYPDIRMRFLKHILLLILLFVIQHSVYSQENRGDQERNRQRLGIQYYQNQEYEKSLSIFSELYREQPNHTNYTYAFYSMMELREYEAAIKLVKRHIRKNDGQLRYRIDLGYVYLRASETEKAYKEFESVIEDLPARPNEIRLIASTFYSRNQLEYAIKTYRRGKELMGGEYSFEGRDAIIAFLDGALGKHMLTQHQVHHPEIELTSDTTATGVWALQDYVINLNEGTTLFGTAYYSDEYVKVDGEWKIKSTGYERVFDEISARKDTPSLQLMHNMFADGK